MTEPGTRAATDTDCPAMVAALQIHAEHQAENVIRLIEVIENLIVRIEELERRGASWTARR